MTGMAGAAVLESGPGWTLWRAASGVLVEVADDLAGVLPPSATVGVVATVWPRGRWTFTFRGTPLPYEAPMAVRADPLLTCAMTVLAAAKQAKVHADDGVRATFGEVATREPDHGFTTESAAGVLDVRAPREHDRDAVVDAVLASARARAERDRTRVEVDADEIHGPLELDALATGTLVDVLGAAEVGSPGADRAAHAARRGEPAVALVLRERDDRLVRTALGALG
ncbi:hypothetical protein FE697_000975 [Mumia zhuanghuii]|uniref:Uncharacterized protein n=2 Tax=Mumia TaxID=1546255 RepID=A0ABW1QHT1_9ACTN|nr:MULTISPECIES: hypothetical protein [Mumia]KAA1424535.1 hypothetical protein FE697_000975 [Mumia zhuanghuii]